MAPLKWINKLERKFGRYAIKNLMGHIVAITAIVYLFSLMDPNRTFLSSLELIPQKVLQGEIWRLITYIFIPPSGSPLYVVFFLYLLYIMGTSLERNWGTFRFNLYYFLGLLLTTVVSFLTWGVATPLYVDLSIFLAFARLYPDFQLVLFFIIPVKVKYLAIINWIYLAYALITEPLARKIVVITALVNYFIFFGRDILQDIKLKKKVYHSRKRFDAVRYERRDTIHKCTICGITEKDDPEMEFRYCSKCGGAYEYCMDHLRDHVHIQD